MRQPKSIFFLNKRTRNKGSAKLKAAEPHMFSRLTTF